MISTFSGLEGQETQALESFFFFFADLYVDVIILISQAIIAPEALLFQAQSPSMGSACCFSSFLRGRREKELV